MPLPFKSKNSSSKSNRPQPPVGRVSSEQQAAGLTTGAETRYSPQQQQYRPADGQPPQYHPQVLNTAAQGVRQSLERPPIDVAASVNAGQIQPPIDSRPDFRPSYNYQIQLQQEQLQQQQQAIQQQQFRQQQQLHAQQQQKQQQQQYTSPQPQVQEQKRGFRERLFGHSSRESVDQTASKPIGRTASLRRKTSPHKAQGSPTEDGQRRSAYWSSRHSSAANLPISHEVDEEGQGQQYSLTPGQASPLVPSKEPANVQYFQHRGSQQQEQQSPFPNPSVQRVNSDLSSQGGYEIYSGSDYSGGSIQATPQLNQYSDSQVESAQHLPQHNQSPPQQQQQHYQHLASPPPYQGFSPSHQLSTAAQISQQIAQAQAQQAAGGPQRQSYSQQQQQQQVPTQHQVSPLPQPTVGQHQSRPPPQSQQDPQVAQAPSYQSQVPEIHQPHPIRGTLQVQPQKIDSPSHLQAPRPSSGQNQFVPPSPLGIIQGKPALAHEATSGSPVPPSSASSGGSDPHLPAASPPQASGQTHGEKARKQLDMPAKGITHPVRESSFQQPQATQTSSSRAGAGQQKPAAEMGRSTPPPRVTAGDMSEEELNQLNQLAKDHKELRDKYQKVKKYYFEKEAQVHALQDTLAHQRLSQSRTSLDDSEYSTRFARLDGLIAQLAFAIRKEWKSIPIWLHPGVNKEAITIGKQEMTAVGRAFISGWLMEEVFDMYFHPDLEQGLSMQLKQVQMNVRKFAPPFQSDEEEEALSAKIIQWRLTTLEGLQLELRSQQAQANRQKLVETLSERLIASVSMHLQDPAPPDLTGGVHMIIELVVGIASHLPCESRDVVIEYFPPGYSVNSEIMKVETGIPQLTNPMADLPDADRADRASLKSTTSDLKDSGEDAAGSASTSPNNANAAPKDDRKQRSGGMLSGLMGTRKPANAPPTQQQQGKNLGASGSQTSLTQPPGSSGGPKEEGAPPRVRMAAFLGVQIRGRSILAKAPVYTS